MEDRTRAGGMMRAAIRAEDTFTGTDPTGTVVVTVDGWAAVLGVEVDADWVHVVGPSAIGDAVLAAHRAAGVLAAGRAMERYTQLWEAGAPGIAARESPPRPEHDIYVQRFDDPSEPARRELEELLRRRAELSRRIEVKGRAGLLTLLLEHGAVIGIAVPDPRRTARARGDQLAAEALSLLRGVDAETAAYREG